MTCEMSQLSRQTKPCEMEKGFTLPARERNSAAAVSSITKDLRFLLADPLSFH